MNIPDEIIPLISSLSRSYGLPIEMWKSDDGNRIMDGFFELAMRLKQSGTDLSRLPRGYSLLVTVFGWEAECQRESWNAFEWIGDLKSVTNAYADIGLGSEARGIERALLAWERSSGDYGAATAAYEEESHKYSSESERLEYLVDYFCSNADELFYVPKTAA